MYTTVAKNGAFSRRKLGILFALFAAGLMGGGYSYYSDYRDTIRREKSELIAGIGSLTVAQVADWRKERLSQLMMLADSPLAVGYIDRLAANPSDREARGLLARRFQAFVKYSNFDTAYYLAQEDGDVLAHAGPDRAAVSKNALKLIRAAKTRHVPIVSTLELDEEGAPVLYMAVLAAEVKERRVFLMASIDPSKVLYPLLQAWPTPSPSGEALLVRRDGDSVLFLNELRHRKGTALKLRQPISSEELPAAVALRGGRGVMYGRDYSGVPVLAWAGQVVGTEWVVISKIDAAEVFAPLRAATVMLSGIIVTMLLAGGIGVYAILTRQEAAYARGLLAAESRFGRLYQQMLDGYVYVDMAGRILECNAAYERLTGYTLEELKSLTYMELTPEAWHKAEERIVKEEILKKGASGIYDKEYRRKDGSLVPVELRTVLDRDAAGKPAGMWAIIRDVSERKAAVAALEKAKDYAESLIQTANAMVIVMDAEGRVTTFSKEAEKITGYTREELEGRSWFETIVPKDRYPEVWDEFNRLMAGGFPAKFDNMILTKSGEERYISWQNSQLTEDGRVTGTLSFGMDITERRRAEREIGTLNKELQEKNLEMESFLYITTHDLRGPLVNIQGFSQNLQQYFGEIKELSARAGLPPSEKSRAEELAGIKIPESLTFILEGSARMDAMLTALLKVSRLGRQELKPELVDAGGLLRTLADTMSFQLREAGAEVKTGPLPPCRADALSVSQMFSNLLDNAVKYREPARPLVIEISGEEAAGKAVYRFRDNGRGIAAGDLDRIWEIFSAQQRAGEKKGEGIGLHMVKRMAGRNGGSIRAESEPGQGSVFIVELPVWEG